MKKLIKFKELTKKQKANRITYLVVSITLYLVVMFLVAFKFSIPAISSISEFMLKALEYTQPSDPVRFIIYYGLTMIFGVISPLIFIALYFGKIFDKLFFKLKVDIGIKND